MVAQVRADRQRQAETQAAFQSIRAKVALDNLKSTKSQSGTAPISLTLSDLMVFLIMYVGLAIAVAICWDANR